MSRDLLHVLAFDTSTEITAVAVCSGDGQVLAEDHAPAGERHAEVLLPKVQRCLERAGLQLADIDLIGVGVGPGSFTGVRVGVSTAKGLGLALNKPVLGVVSLDALAHEARGSACVAPCIDAYKGELFAALYRRQGDRLVSLVSPFHALPSVVATQLAAASGDAEVVVVGPGVTRYPELATQLPARLRIERSVTLVPSAQAIAQLAASAHARGEVPALARVLPVYLRDTDAQLPKQPLRV